ncbi:single-stranded DNA-binding protein [Ruminococcaceae bacterium OttesenSCG-928-I18]|nr:single-stranded DNA-binding protein [Ruminococcaceae bacterium OttesenSCG-928-I18]
MNSVNLLGRTTKDIEVNTTNSGKSVCSFSLAVSGYNDKTDFIDCQAWEKKAEALAKYVSKGQRIGVSGRISTRTYEDKSGNKRKAVEVVVNDFYFADGKKDAGQAVQQPMSDNDKFEEVADEGDLPF